MKRSSAEKMSYLLRPCRSELDYEGYIKLLLQHHAELNLPYPFAVKLSFISSPLVFGRALLILNEDTYEIIGAAGFVYGTGPNQYEDRHICQIEVAFLKEKYRHSFLFAQGLTALVQEMKAGNPEVERVQLWVREDDEGMGRLTAKISGFPGSSRSVVNQLVCHQFPYQAIEAYCQRFRDRWGL
jgi:hypothetical protein